MVIIVLGLIVGIVIGWFFPFSIPYIYSKYMAVAIFACLDSLFGGFSSMLKKNFDMTVFITGFICNALLAAGMTFLGDKLGADIYLAAIFVFSSRIFVNFSIIRRYIIERIRGKKVEK